MLKHVLAGPRRVLIAMMMVLAVLPGLSCRLVAQTVESTEPAVNVDSTALPDAPSPVDFARTENLPDDSSQAAQDAPQQPDKQQPKPAEPGSQTPASELSLGDLGLSPEQVKGDERQQALLDKRTRMLKMHQRLGLITVIPVAAACISAAGAPPERGKPGSTTSRDVHVAIGGLSVAMYSATAYYAIRAPKVSNEPARGGIKLHKYLIYIHAPGMILTPILGAMAFNQANKGEKVHGLAAAHSAVALTTAGAYGAAIVAVSWPIHLKF